MLSKQKPEDQHQQQQQQQEDSQPIITDLSTTASYRSNNQQIAEDKHLVEAPESPYMTTSNEESLESNSNSSNSRKRRKRKASQVMRLTPSENVKRQRTPSPHSNSCSPKHSPKNGADVQEFQPFGLKDKQQHQHQQQPQPQQHELPQENGRASSPPTAATADNSSNSSTIYNDTDNPKTKKQRQALLQRNLTEQQQQQQHRRQVDDEDQQEQQQRQSPASKSASESQMPPPSPQSNSSSSSSSSSSAGTHSSHSSRASEAVAGKDQLEQQQQQLDNNKAVITDTPASPALVEQGDIDAKPAVSVHDDEDEVESPVGKESPAVATTATSASGAAATNATAIGATEPCHFNEVEDKLEKMFAGIEDEPAEQQADEPARAPRADLTAQLALDKDKPLASTPPAASTPTPTPASTPAPTPELRPMATKAAMKSTMPSPIHSPTPLAEPPAKEHVTAQSPAPAAAATPPSAKVPPRTPPTRCLPPRRLSMGMDPSLLRFTIEEPKKMPARKKTAPPPPPPPPETEIMQLDSDDDKPSTSAAAAAALAARKLSEAAAAKALAPKASNGNANANNKKKKKNAPKGKKPTAKNGAKANAGKKGSVRKNFSTDEDSTPAPNRESSNSNNNGAAAPDLRFKSPFIQIKPDGSISIKNTHNAEDVNEKQTKKKHTKAPHERKNLRGMHSSTLSNRYDADTTDSSWICVFCKCGPHKLGLGDLFGPYLVSIDCEEYRTAVQVPAGVHDIDGLFASKRKRSDMVKLHERNLPVVPATLANIMQAPKITMVSDNHN